MDDGDRVSALTFRHSGVTARELRAAKAVARSAGVVRHRVVRLPDMKEAGDIAGGKFEGLPSTYVPMRNSVFYSIAAGYAEEVGADRVIGGHNKDDARVFRDVGDDFFTSLEGAFRSGSRALGERRLRLLRPLSAMTKAEVVKRASVIGVPLELTWSCHGDGPLHCWKCSGCLARLDSFGRAGVADPLLTTQRRGKLLK